MSARSRRCPLHAGPEQGAEHVLAVEKATEKAFGFQKSRQSQAMGGHMKTRQAKRVRL